MAGSSRFKVEYRPSRLVTKLAVLAVIVLSLAALITVRLTVADTRAETEALRAEAAQLEQENQRLDQNLAELGTVRGVIRIAQEQLGLVSPDTIIFQPEE